MEECARSVVLGQELQQYEMLCHASSQNVLAVPCAMGHSSSHYILAVYIVV